MGAAVEADAPTSPTATAVPPAPATLPSGRKVPRVTVPPRRSHPAFRTPRRLKTATEEAQEAIYGFLYMHVGSLDLHQVHEALRALAPCLWGPGSHKDGCETSRHGQAAQEGCFRLTHEFLL